MRSQKTFLCAAVILSFGVIVSASSSWAQSDQYKKKKAATPDAAATPTPGSTPGATDSAAAGAAKGDSDKIDIKDLEQKYWAPKDTDFSVVQNRTYTKAHKLAVSLMGGPVINDPFNSGFAGEVGLNYYFDERFGVQANFIADDLYNSQNTNDFRNLSGGGVLPDYNRDTSYYSVGFNYVPFYAKMSFLGKKIIYFDMQITPTIGIANYEQITSAGDPHQAAFAYGIDITQYFFFTPWLAVRAELHNDWYSEKVVSYGNGVVPAGTAVRSDTYNSTLFLIGVTFFFPEIGHH